LLLLLDTQKDHFAFLETEKPRERLVLEALCDIVPTTLNGTIFVSTKASLYGKTQAGV
jgi:hypothetical protein